MFRASLLFFTTTLNFLPWIGNLNESETLGLFNGTLYDTLESAVLTGTTTQVSAIGFNVSCGYIS
jgi:hypothetical protein